MNAHPITYAGESDGIRFGDLRFDDGEQRHFLYDRLSHRMRLWRAVRWDTMHNREGNEDCDPERIGAAVKAVEGRP